MILGSVLKIKKNNWPLIAAVLFLCFAVPTHFASAFSFWNIGDKIVGALTAIPAIIIVIMLGVVLSIASLYAGVAAMLLNWATQVNILFTRCPTSTPNCIVQMGWTFCRDLTNILFVAILVFIAFAYILRLDALGQIKKSLPRLIIVALLINFSVTFVGIIMDVSQFFINTFSNSIDFSAVFGNLGGFWGDFGKSLISAKILDISTQIEKIIQAVVMIFFNLMLGTVLFLYFFIFIIRIIMIWVLTILSPIAFAANILPQTKGYWSQWLKLLFQWAFVGVYAFFFLFLGFYLMSNLTDPNMVGPPAGDLAFGMTTILQKIFPYLVVIIFLYIGFNAAVKGGPMGADIAMNIASAVGGAAVGFGAAGMRRALSRPDVGKQTQKMAEYRAPSVKEVREAPGIKKVTKGAELLVGRFPGTQYAIRRAGQAGIEQRAEIKGVVENEKKELDKRFGKDKANMPALVAESNKPFAGPEKQVAIAAKAAEIEGAKGLEKLDLADKTMTKADSAKLQELREKKKSGKLEEAEKKRLEELEEKTYSARTAKIAADRSPDELKKLLAADPRLAGMQGVVDKMVASEVIKQSDIAKEANKIKGADGKPLIAAGLTPEQERQAVQNLKKNNLEQYNKITGDLAFNSAIQGIKSEQIADLSPDILKDERFIRHAFLNRGPEFMAKIGDRPDGQEILSQNYEQWINKKTVGPDGKTKYENLDETIAKNSKALRPFTGDGTMSWVMTVINPETGQPFEKKGENGKDPVKKYAAKIKEERIRAQTPLTIPEAQKETENLSKEVNETDTKNREDVKKITEARQEIETKRAQLGKGGAPQLADEVNKLQEDIGNLERGVTERISKTSEKISGLSEKIKSTEAKEGVSEATTNLHEKLGQFEQKLAETKQKISPTAPGAYGPADQKMSKEASRAYQSFANSDPNMLSQIFKAQGTTKAEKEAIIRVLRDRNAIDALKLTPDEKKKYKIT